MGRSIGYTPYKEGKHSPIVCESPKTAEILKKAKRYALSGCSTILLQGETGTGKELFAQMMHKVSERCSKPFKKVNVKNFSTDRVENELFGHEREAYTGAYNRRVGLLEAADGGILFLDEIGKADITIQDKLLRAIENKAFCRVGGTEEIKADVRFILATNEDLSEKVKRGEMRDDFYYRIYMPALTIPPLKEREEDILPLAERFVERFGAREEKVGLRLSEAAKEKLVAYEWPGNVRELRKVIETAVLDASDGGEISVELLRFCDKKDQAHNVWDIRHHFDNSKDWREFERRLWKTVYPLAFKKYGSNKRIMEWFNLKKSAYYDIKRRLNLS